MAVHADDGVVNIAHIVLQVFDQRPELLRHGKADGVRDIDCGRTRGNDRFDDLGEKFRLGARGVLGRELDIFVVRLSQPHPLGGETQNLLVRLPQFMLAVDFRSGEKNMDASAFPGRLDRRGGGFDVLGHAAGQSRNDRSPHLRGDALHRLEVTLADHRKPRLDDIDIEPLKLARDLHFLTQIHRSAGALLPVAQRSVENDNFVGHLNNNLIMIYPD